MFGLAARWPISRSVKYACSAGASAVIDRCSESQRASRSAASAISSGVAVRYQYVSAGLTCPR